MARLKENVRARSRSGPAGPFASCCQSKIGLARSTCIVSVRRARNVVNVVAGCTRLLRPLPRAVLPLPDTGTGGIHRCVQRNGRWQ